MKAFITKGCFTDHGGIIDQGDDFWQVDGKGVHLDGMTHFCPKCKVQARAVGSEHGFMKINGRNPIVAGDYSTCGARYIKISDLAVRDRGAGFLSDSKVTLFSNLKEESKNSLVDQKNNKSGHTLIFFRPNRNYKGEFGFDWLREDDSPVAPQVPSEPPYKDIILGSYKSGYTSKTPNLAAYEDLKTEYEKQNIEERAEPLNEYFVPYLNLFAEDVAEKLKREYQIRVENENLPKEDRLPFVMPSTTAELRLIANVQGQRPEKVEIEFDGQFVLINGQSKTFALTLDKAFTPDTTNREISTKLKIQCIKGNPSDQYINVWAYTSGEKKFAGKLKIFANSYMNIKQLNIFLIEVSVDDLKGVVKEEELILFYKGLYQSLIMPKFQKITMDVSDDIRFRMNSNLFINQFNKVNRTQQSACLQALKQKFDQRYKGEQYANSYPLFFMGNAGSSAGFAFRGQKVGIMLAVREVATLLHEGLHGLGLHHTHLDYNIDPKTGQRTIPAYQLKGEPELKYIFPFSLPVDGHPDFLGYEQGTSNIMSYKKMITDDRIDTWKWQWEILRGVIK